VQKHRLKSIASIVSWRVVGVDPTIMGISPVPGQALEQANLTYEDMDIVEVNRSPFKVWQSKKSRLDHSKTTVNCFAIALGLELELEHPVRGRKGSDNFKPLHTVSQKKTNPL
jgi:acetyl-CoA acetyltransferase